LLWQFPDQSRFLTSDRSRKDAPLVVSQLNCGREITTKQHAFLNILWDFSLNHIYPASINDFCAGDQVPAFLSPRPFCSNGDRCGGHLTSTLSSDLWQKKLLRDCISVTHRPV
jgi:hypothetical protein